MPLGRSVLELTNIQESANYTCVAMSSVGMIEATVQVTVKGESWFQISGSVDLRFHKSVNSDVDLPTNVVVDETAQIRYRYWSRSGFSKMFEGTDTKAWRYFFLDVVLFGVQVSVWVWLQPTLFVTLALYRLSVAG